MPERISLNGATLSIELGETEAKIMSRAHASLFPMLAQFIFTMCRLLLAMAPLGKDKFEGMLERMNRGEDLTSLLQEVGIDVKTLIDKDIQWPSQEEIEKALGWTEQ